MKQSTIDAFARCITADVVLALVPHLHREEQIRAVHIILDHVQDVAKVVALGETIRAAFPVDPPDDKGNPT